MNGAFGDALVQGGDPLVDGIVLGGCAVGARADDVQGCNLRLLLPGQPV